MAGSWKMARRTTRRGRQCAVASCLERRSGRGRAVRQAAERLVRHACFGISCIPKHEWAFLFFECACRIPTTLNPPPGFEWVTDWRPSIQPTTDEQGWKYGCVCLLPMRRFVRTHRVLDITVTRSPRSSCSRAGRTGISFATREATRNPMRRGLKQCAVGVITE